MKIKTQVSISIIVFVILAVVIASSYFSSANQLHEIQKKQQIIDNIEKSSFELYYLENDYIVHGGTRTVERWNAKYAVLTGQLSELTLTDPSQQAVLNSMLKRHADLQTTFLNLVAATGLAQGNESISASQSVKEFAASTLTGHSQMMMSRSSELSQMVKTEAIEVEQRTTRIISFSIAVLMVFVLLNYLLINRSVLRSISALEKGVGCIGSGDLDTTIETKSNDELGDLSLAITAMASNLKTVITSKSNLEKEVAERKRTEEALQESESRFRTLFDSSPDGLLLADAETNRFVMANAAIMKQTGYTEAELFSLSVIDMVPPSNRQAAIEQFKKQTHGEITLSSDQQIQRKDGTVYFANISSTSITLHGRQYQMGIFRDITDRKRAEETLQESEERHRVLLESLSEFVLVYTGDRILYANPPLLHRLGISEEEMYRTSLFDFIAPESKAIVATNIRRREAGEIVLPYEIVIILPSGERMTLYLQPSIHTIIYKGVRATSIVLTDITERKQAEELQKHFTEELELQVKSRTQELEISLNEKVVLLREIQHRVKNNFQIILSLLSLQSRSIGDEKFSRVMLESQNRIRAMAFIHESLYSSADFAHIDLESYVKYLTTQLFTLFEIRSETILLILDIKNIFIDINTAIPLGLIINELVSNSLKHAFPDGRKGQITISIHDEQKGLIITYQDNGIGFSEDFDWQTTENLGFRLIRILIDQLDGTIEQEPCEGACFIIRVMRKTDGQGHIHGTYNPVPE